MKTRSSRSGFLHGRRARAGALGLLAALGLLVASGGLAAAASDVELTDRPKDEPGVARVSLIEGEASYLRGDADDWTGVSVNAPLVTGDRFYSGAASRAEIQLAPAVYARLASETEIGMLELGPDTTQVRMTLGLATFRVRRDPGERHVEIDTPGAAIVVREAGVYRVSVDRDGDTDVQVREGEAAVYVGGERYRLTIGRGAKITGTGSDARPSLYSIEGGDAWDEWEAQRARRVEQAQSYRYVSEEIYGAEDLDEHGDWDQHPEYGPVWRPRDVPVGWAPYTDGRWVWVDPWGWTWLDYAPWGWAPFHYGRWVYYGGYWGWAPGPIVAAPVYAPALVGWYGGWGGGVSVSIGIGFGSIGWVPLGWGEPCFPWWGGWGGVVIGSPWWGGWGGPRIVNNYFITKNITNINIKDVEFVNRRHPGGFSSMPVPDFRRGGRVMPVNARDASGMRPVGGRLPVVPTRDSLPATNPSRVGVTRTAQPPRDALDRRVVSARTPVGGQPSFERKLPLVERNQGAPLTPTTLRQMAAESGRTPAVRSVAAVGRDEVGARAMPSGREALARTPTSQPDGGRSAPTRRSMTFEGNGDARTASRGVPRPPTLSHRGDMPVAPREGGASRQPYVAQRPAFDGDASSGSSRGATAPRTTSREGSVGTSRSPGSPSVRSMPNGARGDVRAQAPSRSSRTLGSNPSGSRTLGSSPSVRSAPTTRENAPRTYFSQPRTLSRPDGGGRQADGYAAVAPRSLPSGRSYGGTTAPSRGAPQVRSAPTRSYGSPSTSAPGAYSAPRTSSAPRTYSAPRSYSAPSTSSAPRTYSAPSSGFSRGSSAPSVRSYSGSSMSRGFSGGGGGRSMGRSMGSVGGGMRGGARGR